MGFFQTCERCGIPSDFTPDIEKCRQLVEGPGLHVAVVGQPASFTVYVVDKNWKKSQCSMEVTYTMRYYETEGEPWKSEEGEARKVTESQYVISYTPRNKKEHNIHIRIGGRPLSPPVSLEEPKG